MFAEKVTMGAAVAMVTLGAAAPTLAMGAEPGRLPNDVVPVDYTISITPNVEKRTLTGSESVVLDVRAATDTLQFNSLNEVLKDVRLDGVRVKHVRSDDQAQRTTVTLERPAALGKHTLSFDYTGKIESQATGLFAQPYVGADGKSAVLLSTQMEATDARRMFPCWDEPAFRATFRLSATVPANWTSISNMPVVKRVLHGGLATVTFDKTPKMPSYLVEFTSGDVAAVSAEAGGLKYSVWATRGLEQNGTEALANAQTIIADYNDYFAYKFPLPKLDSIAVPGGFQGAMENWGAITYNDQLLLLSASSTLKNRQAAYSVQAHEIAHQWNGDLVTMAWWDDIWLNESFASWMAAKETAIRHPDWQWWESEDSSKESAMSADARKTSHAIQQHVTNELQAMTAFDSEITYDKGQAILRMFEAYLGPDVFRSGIRSYMQSFAYGNATTADLWKALSIASGTDVGSTVAAWIEQPGFPLVSVAAQCDTAGHRSITLSQSRFLLTGADPQPSDWRIPLQIRVGSEAVPHALLLTRDKQTTAAGNCSEPLTVNAGAIGFFRTHYDAQTLAVDAKSFAAAPDPDKIALLDDEWALVEAGVDPLPSYLGLAASMGHDLDTRAWSQIAGALGTIEFAERGTAGQDAFAVYARSILKPAFSRLGWSPKPGETPDVQILRETLLKTLGRLGDPEVIEEARTRYAAFVKDRSAIAIDEQSAILSIVGQNADAAAFDSLHSIARTARDETELRRYYSALMSVKDPDLAHRAAEIALSSEIPEQADALRLHFILQLAKEHQQLSWQLFRDNSDRLMKPYAFEGSLIVAQDLPENYWRGIPSSEIEAWVRAHVPAELGSSVDRGMESVRFRVNEKMMLVRSTDNYLRR